MLTVHSPYGPAGDQPKAIKAIIKGFKKGERVALRGITGSGKSFTVAKVIESLNKPTLILAPNKSLAAQLYGEMRQFFPDAAVEYFVSYYDFYQPEAYVAASDMYVEKTATINEEIDRLRHSATQAALSRKDCVIVASVSAIYGLGDPQQYAAGGLRVVVGDELPRQRVIAELVKMRFERNDISPSRGQFRVRGDVMDLWPQGGGDLLRIEWFDDTVEKLTWRHETSQEVTECVSEVLVLPATHYIVDAAKLQDAIGGIEKELQAQLKYFKDSGRLVEAQRLEQRVSRDLEMLAETGWCSGVENYSRYLDGRSAGQRPWTLLDYLGDAFMLVLDESHVAAPQIRGAYGGDRSRKEELVKYGFRLPSALDNRPLRDDELWDLVAAKSAKVLFVSATPADLEYATSSVVVDQIVRPTGLVDPDVEMRPGAGAVADLLGELKLVTEAGYRSLVTTLTKANAESLCDYLGENGINVRYMHSDVDTLERIKLIAELRRGVYDVLVGINLLREGLDLPEVSFVAIMDADTQGFLRSETALVQTIGRAARNSQGRVILYADRTTPAIQAAMRETAKRRALQQEHNSINNIVPQTIKKDVGDLLATLGLTAKSATSKNVIPLSASDPDLRAQAASLEAEMLLAAQELRYEDAATLRDDLVAVEQAIGGRKYSSK